MKMERSFVGWEIRMPCRQNVMMLILKENSVVELPHAAVKAG